MPKLIVFSVVKSRAYRSAARQEILQDYGEPTEEK